MHFDESLEITALVWEKLIIYNYSFNYNSDEKVFQVLSTNKIYI